MVNWKFPLMVAGFLLSSSAISGGGSPEVSGEKNRPSGLEKEVSNPMPQQNSRPILKFPDMSFDYSVENRNGDKIITALHKTDEGNFGQPYLLNSISYVDEGNNGTFETVVVKNRICRYDWQSGEFLKATRNVIEEEINLSDQGLDYNSAWMRDVGGDLKEVDSKSIKNLSPEQVRNIGEDFASRLKKRTDYDELDPGNKKQIKDLLEEDLNNCYSRVSRQRSLDFYNDSVRVQGIFNDGSIESTIPYRSAIRRFHKVERPAPNGVTPLFSE